MRSRHRVASVAMAAAVAILTFSGCSEYQKLRKGVDQLSHSDGAGPTLTNEQEVQLIDSLRSRASFETARDQLTNTAKAMADQIIAAVPGQTWQFSTDEYARDAYKDGSQCDKLTGDIALRPKAKPIAFGAPFTTDGFTAAANIVRGEAAKVGATGQSSLFNEPSKREYDVQGNGYEFRILQMDRAILDITGDCHLLQKVIDMPPGQMPPEPPVLPTDTATPTP
jgi:Lipoprotein confined to pathogenic Mycobacterium